MLFKSFVISALFAAAVAADGVQKPAQDPQSGPDTVHGCYKSKGTLKSAGENGFQTQGECAKTCRALGKPVGATQVKECWCGDTYPPKSSLTKDDACGEPCPGYGVDACGGLGAWTVYNIGIRKQVADDPDPSTSSSKAPAEATSSAPAASTSSAAPSATASDDADSGNKTNTVGIAVGVVVGLIVLSAICGGAFFFYRRRRNAEIEEEHRRNAAVNAFIAGGKPPSSSGGLSLSDQRLDPVMAQRRMSDGSIADNEDYSRRILRVTNA
ncbi:WSC domain-containing protein [Apiospora saccharicola]|uniref:WSC domain-containing protein n=1 Tax=Apiospora saccharicola TaxID=335842 RepID=A0ABR1WGL7_9PEZI